MKEIIVKKDKKAADENLLQSNLVEKPKLKIVLKKAFQALYKDNELLLGLIGNVSEGLVT